MALDGIDRHPEECSDLRRFEVFLISQRYDHPGFLRQSRDDPAQRFTHHRVCLPKIGSQFRQFVDVDVRLALVAPRIVDRTMTRHPPKPEDEMRWRLDLREVPV